METAVGSHRLPRSSLRPGRPIPHLPDSRHKRKLKHRAILRHNLECRLIRRTMGRRTSQTFRLTTCDRQDLTPIWILSYRSPPYLTCLTSNRRRRATRFKTSPRRPSKHQRQPKQRHPNSYRSKSKTCNYSYDEQPMPFLTIPIRSKYLDWSSSSLSLPEGKGPGRQLRSKPLKSKKAIP